MSSLLTMQRRAQSKPSAPSGQQTAAPTTLWCSSNIWMLFYQKKLCQFRTTDSNSHSRWRKTQQTALQHSRELYCQIICLHLFSVFMPLPPPGLQMNLAAILLWYFVCEAECVGSWKGMQLCRELERQRVPLSAPLCSPLSCLSAWLSD